MSTSRELDVVLWGATGYTGRLVADYLATTPHAATLTWALAGRDRHKLERIRVELAAVTPRLADLPILIGEAHDRASLDAIAARTRVVCTTVGPYARYGSELVAACAAAGTHYCDLTGEVPWMREMIDAHHDTARASGARIVHTCGFDSIPSDLGVLMLHHAMRERGDRLARVDAFFRVKGGPSGGTIHSMLGILDAARRDPAARKLLGDPYALNPATGPRGFDGPDPRGVRRDRRAGGWVGPFVMAVINTRVVRRSNALLDGAYGELLRYQEQMTFPDGVRGLAMAGAFTAGLAAFAAASQVPPLRKRLEARLPGPGQGPTQAEREAGFHKTRMFADGVAGTRLLGRIEDHYDPGYGSTSRMLAEAALCLALDPLDSPGGVLTPASAMGVTLIERLRAIGMVFEVENRE
ncbi:MAG: saccharopine dehydrogenase NADP-binding domain-containing protein [Kofleriaceae bacterium]|nr:saccharopine dehydrogenase NADP-binding domain-containing protein [Myxococcales bacterium]MCB9559689.1 saccharopine dehydrogenase NADP-binding domain-containing protein [Kofleriaceae bacterium]